MNTEQLNIVGKRSGSGFIAHKAMLVNALSRTLSERVQLLDFTIGRKGLLGYLKSLSGSNIVKVVPSTSSLRGDSVESGQVPTTVDASGAQVNGHKRLKVTCGANTSYLDDLAWVGEKAPLSLCDVRVSPSNTVKPNIGSLELAEALNRVLPFTAKDDNRPVLDCINFVAKEGKLTLVSADGFRLSVVTLDFDDVDWQALINREELGGIPKALRKAKRLRISFEPSGDSLEGINLILDTELIRYKWTGAIGSYPEWQKLIPTGFNTCAHFDSVEALKAIASLKVLADSKSYPIDLTFDNGYIVLSNTDYKGQTTIPADIEGKPIKVRIDGSYLTQALKACGGMVDFKLTNAYSPMLFSVDGYQLVVMPMMTSEANEQAKRDSEAKQAQEPAVVAEAEKIAKQAEQITEAEAEVKPKRNRKKEKVAVA